MSLESLLSLLSLFQVSCRAGYVTKILRGKVNFTLATMVRLARALDVGQAGAGKRPARYKKTASAGA